MAYGGWTGKVLRVDLSTGVISSEDTSKYMPFLGGTGLGYKVLWDEVPAGTKAFDPENRLIFGVGPLTGTGTPCSGRVSITSLWPPHPDELPGSGHMGGHWGPELKYAGWDSIIVQGASTQVVPDPKDPTKTIEVVKPVWLKIVDDKVTIEDASQIWGQGIYRATAYVCENMGADAHVAAIGQCGENQLRLATVECDRSHSAGGVGGVMGSKGLKAIGVKGTGALKIAADKKAWKDLIYYYLGLMGCNNQGVVAQSLQPWSEFSPASTRWWAAPGRTWGAATPPVDTGICADIEHPSADCPKPLNKMGLRTHKGFGDFQDEGLRRTVRMDGCHACPIRCHIATDVPALEQYGVSRYNMNTCIGNSIVSGLYPSASTMTAGGPGKTNPQENPILLSQMSNYLGDDYGLWSDYGQYSTDFKWYRTAILQSTDPTKATYNPPTIPDPANPGGPEIPNPWIGKPVLQKYLSPQEWTMLRTTPLWNTGKSPFDLLEAGDARFMQFLVPYVAQNKPGTLGWFMGMGPARLAALWPELDKAHRTGEAGDCVKMGHAKHHSIETKSQLGGLINLMYNRDPQNHTHQNFAGNGLPESASNNLKDAICQEIVTSGTSIFQKDPADTATNPCWDVAGTNTPVNTARAAFVAKSLISLEVHNSSTQCDYTLPVWASPLKSRNYRGDTSIEARAFTAVTGVPTTEKDLETTGLRIFTLFRALTALHMEKAHPGTISGKDVNPLVNVPGQPEAGKYMRGWHDYVNDWNYKPGQPGQPDGVGTKAPTGLDRVEFENAKSLLYDQLGCDRTTGMPTRATLSKLGLDDVAAALAAEGLLPA